MSVSYAAIAAVQERYDEYRRYEARERRGHFLFFLLLLGLVALALAACAPGAAQDGDPGGTPTQEPVTSYEALLEALRAAGARAEPTDTEIDQPFFTPPVQFMTVNGGDVQVLVYDSESAAAAEAALVGPDGLSVGANMVTWVASPHFFRAG